MVDTIVLELNIATQQVTKPALAAPFDALDVAAVTVSTGNTTIFAVLADGNAYVLIGGGAVPLSWQQLSAGASFRQLSAALDATGAAHVFLVGTDNVLYHLAPNTQQSSGYADPAPLMSSVAQVAVASDDNGAIDVLAAGTAASTLTHLYKGELSTGWEQDAVEVETNGQVETYVSYTCDITLFDATGAPLASTPVQLWASEEAKLLINGASYTVGPNLPASVTTNAGAILSVAQPTSGLAIPTLLVSVPSLMGPGESVAVTPNADVTATLGALTGAELLAANDVSGNPILAGSNRTQTTADAVASAVSECVNLTVTALAASSASKYLHPKRRRPGVAYFAGDKASLRKIHRPMVPDSHWQISFGAGGTQFERLSAAGANALLVEKRASIQSSAGLFEWISDIGDFVMGVVDDIIDVVNVVVTTIADGICAAITFVLDGVTYLFHTVMDTVEQALDLVETVFAQVAIVFEQVFEWLGFLFSWPDILRTHTAISWVVNQALSFLSQGAVALQAKVDAAFGSLQSQVAGWFAQAIAQVGPTQTIGGYNDASEQSDPTFSDGMANNVVYNGFIDNLSGASSATDIGARLTATLAISFDSIQTILAQFATNTEMSGAFTAASAYFTNLGGSPDQVFQGVLAGLLSVCEGLVQAMIAGAQAVVDAIFQLAATLVTSLQTYLGEAWDIPFVSALYAFVTDGATLSLLDLVSLIAAVPVTILCKVLNGAAPFPDDASVTAFQTAVTATSLLNAIGLGSSNVSRGLPEDDPTWTGLLPPQMAQLMATLGSVSAFFYRSLTAVLDAFPPAGEDPPAVLVQATVALEAATQFCGCPWFYSSGSLACSTGDGASRWLWIYDDVGLLLDFIYMQAGKGISSDVQAVVSTMLGAFRFALAIPASIGGDGVVWANNLIGCVPGSAKFLRYSTIVASTEGISLGVLVVIDALCAISLPILGFVVTNAGIPPNDVTGASTAL